MRAETREILRAEDGEEYIHNPVLWPGGTWTFLAAMNKEYPRRGFRLIKQTRQVTEWEDEGKDWSVTFGLIGADGYLSRKVRAPSAEDAESFVRRQYCTAALVNVTVTAI